MEVVGKKWIMFQTQLVSALMIVAASYSETLLFTCHTLYLSVLFNDIPDREDYVVPIVDE
jgi:hypothetical protein